MRSNFTFLKCLNFFCIVLRVQTSNRISGDDGRVVPPVPMPNTVVKHTHAESTCLETGLVWRRAGRIGRCRLSKGTRCMAGAFLCYCCVKLTFRFVYARIALRYCAEKNFISICRDSFRKKRNLSASSVRCFSSGRRTRRRLSRRQRMPSGRPGRQRLERAMK